MKKNKWLALLLAAMMTFGVTACGGGGGDDKKAEAPPKEPVVENVMEDADYVGDWDCIGYDADGQSMTEEECGDSWLTLYDNYTTETVIMDKYYEGEWDFTESGVVLYLYDGGYEEEIYCDMVDTVMYMDYMNMYTLFEKAE